MTSPPFRFLADENIAPSTIAALRKKGYEVQAVSEISPGISDLEVLKLAEKQNAVVLTLDVGFGEMLYFSQSSKHKVVIVRGKPNTPETVTLLLLGFLKGSMLAKLAEDGFMAILSSHKVRIYKK